MAEPTPPAIADRLKALARWRRRVLDLPPERALERILNHEQPAALVHSFAAEDLYLLIHDIGPSDCLPVLALTSAEQRQFILDQEIWRGDRVDVPAVGRWLDLLLQADLRRTARWLLNEQTELLEYYLFHNIRVAVREDDQDPSEFGPEWFSDDGTLFVRLLPPPESGEGVPPAENDSGREERLLELLRTLAGHDPAHYRDVLFEAMQVVPAESEEEAYRLRGVRLAEKGFLPYEEAVGVYQPLRPEDLARAAGKRPQGAFDPEGLAPQSLLPALRLASESLFVRALRALKDPADLMQLQGEFAALCNQVAVADRRRVRRRQTLDAVVAKVAGYLNVALERTTAGMEPDAAAARAGARMKHAPLADLFRVGFGLALELKWRARRWQEKSWAAAAGLPLGFWGERWLGVVGGLLLKKPLFFDDYRRGTLYREFESLEEIRTTAEVLDQVTACDDLLAALDVERAPDDAPVPLSWQNLLLTLWARQALERPPGPLSLTVAEFRPFFETLFDRRGDPAVISDAAKAAFLEWLAAASGRPAEAIAATLGPSLEELFAELESEYGLVRPRDLDPRYVLHFRLTG